MIIFQLLRTLLIGNMPFAVKSFLTNARIFKHDCRVIVAHPDSAARLSGAMLRATIWNTVWPETLAGRYYGGLLKICHLAEFTFYLAIMIFIAKWVIKRAGNLTGL